MYTLIAIAYIRTQRILYRTEKFVTKIIKINDICVFNYLAMLNNIPKNQLHLIL